MLTAEQLIGMRRVSSAVPSPDGSYLVVAAERLDTESSSKYVSDLWRVPLDGSGRFEPLTRGKWNDRAPTFLHDGSLAFLSNRPTGVDDGHEKRSQIFAFRPFGGDPEPLTDEPLGVMSYKAARDADVIALVAPVLLGTPDADQRKVLEERAQQGPSAILYEDMPVRFWDHWLPQQVPHLFVYRQGERVDLTPDARQELRRADWDLARDGSLVALNPSRPGTDRIDDQSAELIDTESGQRRVLASAERTWFSAPVFSPDGSRLAMVRHQRRDGTYGKSQLNVVEVASGAARELGRDIDAWLHPAAWTADGAEILCLAAWRTHAPVFAVDVESGAVRRITAASAGGSHHSVALAGGGRVVGVRSALLEAPHPFVCDLQTDSTPQSVANLADFAAEGFSVESCTVRSTDGADVQYTVVKRDGARTPLPVLNWIHGGPIGDWGDVWHWRWNSLVAASEGYLVVLPNPRGSTGFGQAFVEGIWNNSWGAQCHDDLVAVFDDVERRPDADAARTTAMGGSFGGYMTNWLGTQTDRFARLVTHASIFDLAAFHGATDLPSWWAYSFGIHPYEAREQFDRYSPMAHVANWKTPTLIIHGEKDYRVPVGEALALFEALRFHGVDAKLLVYPDENHWILRPKNIVSWYQAVFDFIKI